ncbi:MAG: hybrid sensor histidine kinase/response regulator, partial [Rivularia sp. (in: cyanobacteria)]
MAVPINLLLLSDAENSEKILSLLQESEFTPVAKQIENEADLLTNLNYDLEIILADYQHRKLNIVIAQEILQQKELYVPFIVFNGKNNAPDA